MRSRTAISVAESGRTTTSGMIPPPPRTTRPSIGMEDLVRLGLGGVGTHRVTVRLFLLLLLVVRLPLDAAAARRIPLRRRDLQRRVGAEPEQRLHQPLAEGRRPDHQRPVVILERSRDDLRGRRRAVVHQDHDGEVRVALGFLVAELAGRALRPPARRDDLLPGLEEQRRDRDPLVQQAAGVPAQVEDQRPHPGPLQAVDRGRQLAGGLIAEGIQLDVADVPADHHGGAHRAPRGSAARVSWKVMTSCTPGPLHPEGHLGTDGAAQVPHGQVLVPRRGVLAVHLDDAVPGHDAGALGRRVRQRRDHHDGVVPVLDLDAEAAVVARRDLAHPRQALAAQEYAVGIVQLVHHPRDGHRVQLALVDRVHVVVGDVRHHVVEQTRPLVHAVVATAALLHEPAAGQERHDGYCGGDDDTLTRHGPFLGDWRSLPRTRGEGRRATAHQRLPHLPLHGVHRSVGWNMNDVHARRRAKGLRHPEVEGLVLPLQPVPHLPSGVLPHPPDGRRQVQHDHQVRLQPPVARALAASTAGAGRPRPPIW